MSDLTQSNNNNKTASNKDKDEIGGTGQSTTSEEKECTVFETMTSSNGILHPSSLTLQKASPPKNPHVASTEVRRTFLLS